MPYSEPATFTALRFFGVLVVMVPLALLARISWPTPRQRFHIAVSGVLFQAVYLYCLWKAIRLGMGAGLVALIVGLQPVLTAVAASLLGERTTLRQWLGLGVGFAGVSLVVWDRMHLDGVPLVGLGLCAVSLVAITTGTLYQKRFCPKFDLRAGSVLQFSASLLVVLPIALLSETRQISWNLPMSGALVWSILVLSIGATSLLFVLLRQGGATQVSSLMYLTPATTAILAWLLFDEPLTPLMVTGMIITALGVASVAGRPPVAAAASPAP
ncbi:DMT family transporter [Pigmentiphaga aceris]|uniref:DMT family transporter n=2 Tax=Pigmentiphaga aceris TaxID=1940612 RepID=A0A5C0B723_9BURK|nr:DMT family transporter [Pigmentiphaga aceris]